MLSNILENVKYQNFKLFWCNKGSVHICGRCAWKG